MGHMRAHTVVVTGWRKEAVVAARDVAAAIYDRQTVFPDVTMGRLVSPVIDGVQNGQASFFVAPDGSKEWWETSDASDKARAEFIAWLRRQDAVDWVEVQFADDNCETLIAAHSDDMGGVAEAEKP